MDATRTIFDRIVRMGYKAVRTPTHKYIRYNELDGMNELYDLARDPHEMYNLIDDPNYAPRVAALEAELARLIESSPPMIR